jgi:RHS repeat-associated protein
MKENLFTEVNTPQINLPKGGGAIRGIGETFSPNGFSGTSSFTVPIPVSPCRGFEPALALQYSSASGNGPFGLGFSLTTPSISCATNKGTPRYDGSDHYVMDGNYLVPLNGKSRNEILNGLEFNVQNYAPRQLGDFSLIEFWQDKNQKQNSFWKITSANHIISIFGITSEGQISNPDHPEQIFCWLLQEAYDPVGNHQIYKYKKEDAVNVPDFSYEKNRTIGAQRYLTKVLYGNEKPIADSILTGQEPDSLIKSTVWLFEIIFNYGEFNFCFDDHSYSDQTTKDWEYRSDPFSTYEAGFEIRTYRLCKDVLLFHRFGERLLVQSSTYRYDELKLENGYISQLIGVTDTGYKWKDGKAESASYPELELGYTTFEPSGKAFEKLNGENGRLNGLNENPYSLVDLFGRGIPGILYADGQTVSYREPVLIPQTAHTKNSFSESQNLNIQNNDFRYGNWELQNKFPLTNAVSGEGISMNDQTGNGQLDLMMSQPGNTFYWQANANGTWSLAKTFEKFPLNFGIPNQTQINATGAGLSDLFQIRNEEILVNPSTRENGFGDTITHVREKSMPSTLESSEVTQLQLVDMAGSGTPQFVKVENGNVTYWPNFSYGRFGRPIKMGNAPKFPGEFNTSRLFFADIDGSGTSDFVYLTGNTLYIYFNQNGNSFSDALKIELPYIFDSLDGLSFADVYGQGTTCAVLSYPHGLPDEKSLSPEFLCYDFCAHKKPYLLNKINNNLGAETEIEYASSVDYYLANKKANQDWITNIPFPVQVIAKTTVKDALSNSSYTSLYSYSHGYYDGEEREFKGFGRVDTQDTEYFFNSEKPEYVAPVQTRTWYNVGCPKEQYDLLMAQYKKEYFKGDDQAFSIPDSIIDCDNPESWSQAYAALAGTMVHSEVYALDDSNTDAVPYTVSESNYKVTLRQKKEKNWYAVFFVQARESINYTYDRNAKDPQIHQQFTLEVDEFGNVLKEASVAYPRRGTTIDADGSIKNDTLNQQFTTKVMCTISQFINHPKPIGYLLGVSFESQSYHLPFITAPKNKAFTFDAIVTASNQALEGLSQPNPSSKTAVLLSWERMIYAKLVSDETTPLPLGVVCLPVLPYQAHSVLDSQKELLEIYKDALDETELTKKLKEAYYTFDPVSNYWWNQGATQHYFGSTKFFLPSKTILPYLENGLEKSSDTSFEYDAFKLILKKTRDALGNATEIEIDYQVLQPKKVIDPNETVTEFSFDPLGQVIYTTEYGFEDGKPAGFAPISEAPNNTNVTCSDIIAHPEKYLGNMQSFFHYDLFAYERDQQPVYALSLVAINYPGAAAKAQLVSDFTPIQIHLEYSDGLGRELQSTELTGQEKEQWLTTGKKYYNNKGEVIREYEPYYKTSFIYTPALEVGVSSTLYYDPVGRLIKTITPNGFLHLQKYWPWQVENWDANDSIKESPYYKDNILNPDESSPYYNKALKDEKAIKQNLDYVVSYFADTPETSLLDNMGNNIVQLRINKYPSEFSDPLKKTPAHIKDILPTYNQYDILGRLQYSADPRLSENGILNFTMQYAMGVDKAMKTISVDAGTSWDLPNIMGNSIFSFDSRKITSTHYYDELQRPVRVHIKDDLPEDNPQHVDQNVQQLIYGDTPGSGAPAKYNLKGQLYKNFESSGLSLIDSYSLTGAAMHNQVCFFKDYKKQGNWNDISLAAQKNVLQDNSYANKVIYDALGRVIEETDSDNNRVCPQYFLNGWLNKLRVLPDGETDFTDYVKNIRYDAKGQRLQVDYGNNTRTTNTYNPKTYELMRIRTCRMENEQEKTCIQDIAYCYDPVGNVYQKETLSEETIFYDNEQVKPVNTYYFDAIYQLIQAAGREKVEILNPANPDAAPSPKNDLLALQNYIERYKYDRGGNMTKSTHAGKKNKEMVVSDTSNRSVERDIKGENSVVMPIEVDDYFDPNGNQVKLKTIHPLQWNCMDALQSVTIIERESGKNDTEYYVYDSSGKRVRKIKERYDFGGNRIAIKQTYYLGNLEIRQEYDGAALESLELKEDYHSLRLLDGDHGVATRSTWLKGNPPKGCSNPVLVYHLQDHLNSYTVQVSHLGEVIAQEEYSPFGESTLRMETGTGCALIHYRYSGKEQDSATGFYYYGMRYYASWLCRWINPDPAGTIDGLNVYLFVSNNPVTFVDVGGMKGGKPNTNVLLNKSKKITHNHKRLTRYQIKLINAPSPEKIGSFVKLTPEDIINLKSTASFKAQAMNISRMTLKNSKKKLVGSARNDVINLFNKLRGIQGEEKLEKIVNAQGLPQVARVIIPSDRGGSDGQAPNALGKKKGIDDNGHVVPQSAAKISTNQFNTTNNVTAENWLVNQGFSWGAEHRAFGKASKTDKKHDIIYEKSILKYDAEKRPIAYKIRILKLKSDNKTISKVTQYGYIILNSKSSFK